MSDQGRWWKLWTTAPTDSRILALPPSIRWAWAALGTYVKVHGEHGTLKTKRDNPALAVFMGVKPEEVFDTLHLLPNVHIEEGQSDNDDITVIILKWKQFQEDSTVYERVKRWRAKQHDNGTRGEEKRRDTKRLKSLVQVDHPSNGNDPTKAIVKFWVECFSKHHQGRNPVVNWPKHMKVAKTLLSGRNREEVEWMISELFDNPPQIAKDKGLCDLSVLLSSVGQTILARRRSV